MYYLDKYQITNAESFVLAIFACIYEELKSLPQYLLEPDKEHKINLLDETMRYMITILKAKQSPGELLNRFDMLELLQDCTAWPRLQSTTDKLMKIFPETIKITVWGNENTSWSSLLPDFKGKVVIKYETVEDPWANV